MQLSIVEDFWRHVLHLCLPTRSLQGREQKYKLNTYLIQICNEANIGILQPGNPGMFINVTDVVTAYVFVHDKNQESRMRMKSYF